MSLHIYIGEENLPEHANVIKDVERYFMSVVVPVDDFSKRVIKEVDEGELIVGNAFIDRFGYKLRLSECSTGSKIVLAVKYTNDIILADEMGLNCDELLMSITEGQVYFSCRDYAFDTPDIDLDIEINGVKCKSADDVCDFMSEFSREGV